MKGSVGATMLAVLFSIAAVCTAYPSQASDEDLEAQTQWWRRHLSAPHKGCVEVDHRPHRHTHYRAYVCDGLQRACVFSLVNRCPQSALYHSPSLEKTVNVRSRPHLIRFYDQIGGACFSTLLPDCCTATATDEAEVMGDAECRCETLPTGEKVCDPYGCEKGGDQQEEDIMTALLEFLQNK